LAQAIGLKRCLCKRCAVPAHNYSPFQRLGCSSMGRLLVSCLAVCAIVGVFGTRIHQDLSQEALLNAELASASRDDVTASVLKLSVDSNMTSPINESPPPTEHCPSDFKGSCHSESKFKWNDALVTIPAGNCYTCKGVFVPNRWTGQPVRNLQEERCLPPHYILDSKWLYSIGTQLYHTGRANPAPLPAAACCELQSCTMGYSAFDAPRGFNTPGAICCQKKDNTLVKSFLSKSQIGVFRKCPNGYQQTSNLLCPWSWPATVPLASICCLSSQAILGWELPSWDSWWKKRNPCPEGSSHLPHKQCLEFSIVDAKKVVGTNQ